jgi:methyltransferase-like protein
MKPDHIKWESVFSKKRDILSRKIAEETFLVPIRGEIAHMQKIFMLNPVAEYIWQELDGKNSLSEIRNGILENFDVDKKQVNVDIQEFITQLIEVDLVVGGT